MKILKICLSLLLVAVMCVSCAPKSEIFYIVEYQAVQNGAIDGDAVQRVKGGGEATAVTAIPNMGYSFERWSDGVTDATREDKNITSDILVYPIFKPIPYSITYRGECDGKELYAYVLDNTNGDKISFNASAILSDYSFISWSDSQSGDVRTDGYEKAGTVITAFYKQTEYDIPKVYVDVENGQDITSKEKYLNCIVSIYTEKHQEINNASAQIKGRGNFTWVGSNKHSYRVKFTEKQSVLGSKNEDRNWVLMSNAFDKALSRNYIAYELGERFKTIAFSSMHEFVELYVNEEYVGLYMMCDLVQTGKGRLEINEDLSNPNDFGFFVELDSYADDEAIENIDYFPLKGDGNRTYRIRTPDTEENVNYDPAVHLPYIRDYLSNSLDAINSKDWALIQKYIDPENFAEMYIIQECMQNADVGWNSFFMYKDKGGRLCCGPVWDFDQSVGNFNAFGGAMTGIKNNYPTLDLETFGILWGVRQNVWFKTLLEVPEFTELLRKKLDELDSTIKNVYELVNPNNPNGLYCIYKEEMEKNFEYWDILDKNIGSNTAHIASINTVEGQHLYMYEWLTERLRVVRIYHGLSAEKNS